jgi:hypothetical protein
MRQFAGRKDATNEEKAVRCIFALKRCSAVTGAFALALDGHDDACVAARREKYLIMRR